MKLFDMSSSSQVLAPRRSRSMKITGAHDAGVGERRGCFMKGVMAFITCIMFGRTLLPHCEDVAAELEDRKMPA